MCISFHTSFSQSGWATKRRVPNQGRMVSCGLIPHLLEYAEVLATGFYPSLISLFLSLKHACAYAHAHACSHTHTHQRVLDSFIILSHLKVLSNPSHNHLPTKDLYLLQCSFPSYNSSFWWQFTSLVSLTYCSASAASNMYIFLTCQFIINSSSTLNVPYSKTEISCALLIESSLKVYSQRADLCTC